MKSQTEPVTNVRMGSALRLLLFLAVSLLLWSLWSEAIAQTTTNASPATATSQPVMGPLERPAVWLTFGLDRIELFRHRAFADIRLWLYLASFIYIFRSVFLS